MAAGRWRSTATPKTKAVEGRLSATLTSVVPRVDEADPTIVTRVLQVLGWDSAELDRALPARIGFAGARHLVIAASRDRLARLDYAFDELGDVMRDADLTTVALVWREAPLLFHARNPFPVGGVVEDPRDRRGRRGFGRVPARASAR